MKKFFATILVLSLLLVSLVGLVACNPTDDEPSDSVELNIIDDSYRNWYEIFVHSFYDTDNDGIGDLNGVTAKLDYIKEMGFNGIWLMPIHPSPTYHKYDVKDYYAIDPDYGTLDDFKTLITEAHNRGIRVIIDLVVNHSSDQHPWFKEACNYIRQNGQPGGQYGDFYNFRITDNNKYSSVSGTQYSYESQFWSGMPDLNLDSPAMRAEIINIMQYWLEDYDVDGFRLDAVTSYYTGYLQKNIDFLGWLNTEAKKIKPNAYIVGEAWVGDDYTIDRYYESGVDSFFLFTGAQAGGQIASLVKQGSGNGLGNWFEKLQNTYGENAILAPFLGNHDTMRPGSFMPGVENLKMAAGVMSMMSGGTFVYYGEEIGMKGARGGAMTDANRRLAMLWGDDDVRNPVGSTYPDDKQVQANVLQQLEDENSLLRHYCRLLTIRHTYPAIARGDYEKADCGSQELGGFVITYEGEQLVLLHNVGDEAITIDLSACGLEAGKLLEAIGAGDASLKGSTLTVAGKTSVLLK